MKSKFDVAAKKGLLGCQSRKWRTKTPETRLGLSWELETYMSTAENLGGGCRGCKKSKKGGIKG